MVNWPRNMDSDWTLNEDLLLEPLPLEDQLARDHQTLRPDRESLPETVGRMSKKDLKEFVVGVLENRIFTSHQIKGWVKYECPECKMRLAEEMLNGCPRCGLAPVPVVTYEVEPEMVFLPLAWAEGKFREFLKENAEDIGGFWGPLSSALPRGFNGYPMLMEMSIVHKNDWAKAHCVIQQELRRRDELDLDNI